jgi:hypothetical protein
MRTVAGVGDLMQRTGDNRTGRLLGGRSVERSGWRRVQSAPDMWRLGAQISWLSLKTKVDSLCVVWPQNYSDGFRRFDLKTGSDGF